MKRNVSYVEICLLPKDKRYCIWISNWIVFQCIAVFIGSATIGFCVWSPEHSVGDFDKLFRIMYLYDPHACGYELRSLNSVTNLKFSDNTLGLNILPIVWTPTSTTVSTKFSSKTRKYIRLSAIIHVFWLVTAIFLRTLKCVKRSSFQKILLAVAFYAIIFVTVFDLSMAIVYIAHIQQSLTKGMILRYSGWSVEMTVTNYYDFGGWLPIIGSICWVRGIFVFALNVYCSRVLQVIRRKVKKQEVRERLALGDYGPIPEPSYTEPLEDDVLYVKPGDYKPYTRNNK